MLTRIVYIYVYCFRCMLPRCKARAHCTMIDDAKWLFISFILSSLWCTICLTFVWRQRGSSRSAYATATTIIWSISRLCYCSEWPWWSWWRWWWYEKYMGCSEQWPQLTRKNYFIWCNKALWRLNGWASASLKSIRNQKKKVETWNEISLFRNSRIPVDVPGTIERSTFHSKPFSFRLWRAVKCLRRIPWRKKKWK